MATQSHPDQVHFRWNVAFSPWQKVTSKPQLGSWFRCKFVDIFRFRQNMSCRFSWGRIQETFSRPRPLWNPERMRNSQLSSWPIGVRTHCMVSSTWQHLSQEFQRYAVRSYLIILIIYSCTEFSFQIVVIWNDVDNPPNNETLRPLDMGDIPLHVIMPKKNSLLNRFIPWDVIGTKCVLIIDDDIRHLTPEMIDWGFRWVYQNAPRASQIQIKLQVMARKWRQDRWVHSKKSWNGGEPPHLQLGDAKWNEHDTLKRSIHTQVLPVCEFQLKQSLNFTHSTLLLLRDTHMSLLQRCMTMLKISLTVMTFSWTVWSQTSAASLPLFCSMAYTWSVEKSAVGRDHSLQGQSIQVSTSIKLFMIFCQNSVFVGGKGRAKCLDHLQAMYGYLPLVPTVSYTSPMAMNTPSIGTHWVQ